MEEGVTLSHSYRHVTLRRVTSAIDPVLSAYKYQDQLGVIGLWLR